MNYGFVIDNRKCIGCHACTVACKAEHDVPVGVNRTWVKYIEKGEFPNTRRLFSVMRCNHCEDAPCVSICPTKALFTRADGIVDFDNRRCIACKACMQACPYDALHIDPSTHTAAKCNYCAHRIEVGLEPSCVVVCPEHAIISGDMEDPSSEIAQVIAHENVTARKVEKGTRPNLFYIDGDEVQFNPTSAVPSADYMWSAQTAGVGHFAKYADERVASADHDAMLAKLAGGVLVPDRDVADKAARRVYDAPTEGPPWGWEVAGYVWTKAIATGAFLVPFLAIVFGFAPVSDATIAIAIGVSLLFLAATTVLLVKDLGQPRRFLYVLLRPQWRSWLVRGGYALTIYGGLVTLYAVGMRFAIKPLATVGLWGGAAFAVVTAIYTAFLFAQSKGRDFWQSPALVPHMLFHAVAAGAAVFAILLPFADGAAWATFVTRTLLLSVIASGLVAAVELAVPHATEDAKRAAHSITSGRFKKLFWLGGVIIGLLLPAALIVAGGAAMAPMAGIAALVGVFCIEYVWVRAPQMIPLS